MKDVRYTAYFVDDPSALLVTFPPKHAKVYAHHSTNHYEPKDLSDLEIGKKTRIKILGRVSDEKGDVLLVENSKSKKKFPHITLSCAEGVPSVYSNKLLEEGHQNNTVELFDNEYYVDVTEGYATPDGEIVKEI